MSRRQKDPLRPLGEAERTSLSRLSRSQSAPAAQVARARTLLAVAEGQSYTAAARLVGRDVGDTVARWVAGFNRDGLAALVPHHGGGHAALHAARRQLAEHGRVHPAHPQAARARRPAPAEPGGDRHLVPADRAGLEPATHAFHLERQAPEAAAKATRRCTPARRLRRSYPAAAIAMQSPPTGMAQPEAGDPLVDAA
jgi:hypothetical protein